MNYIFSSSIGSSHSAWLDLIILTTIPFTSATFPNQNCVTLQFCFRNRAHSARIYDVIRKTTPPTHLNITTHLLVLALLLDFFCRSLWSLGPARPSKFPETFTVQDFSLTKVKRLWLTQMALPKARNREC